MLAIPIVKPVNVPVLDTSGLYRYLSTQQPQNEHNINKDIAAFISMRESAISFTEPTDIAIQQLLVYCHQLKAFAPRFNGVENELNLSFSWLDGFAATKKISTSSFYFDWACCLWNLAAFESLRGARIDRTTEEGIRAANKHFQQAAGYFEYIREHVLPKIKIQTIPSLSEDSLLMAKNLMLAQAQLCFYEKAVKDKKKDLMKSAIIAKLAAQTSAFYALASTSCRSGQLGPLLDLSWFAITDFQSKCFHGAAEYWQAVASKETALSKGTGYGEEIARYCRAENFVSQALALSKKHSISPSLPAGAEGLLAAILANKKTAEYDLSTIYMEGVPHDSSLVEVVPVAMVRPSALPELTTVNITPSETIFRYVLPKELLESSRKFQDEVSRIYLASQVDADNATNIGRVTLSSVGLPGSLEAIKSEVPLPDGLWVKIQRVQSMGGFDRLPRMFDDQQAAARRALSTMSAIDESLEREERVDQEFRSRYADWNGPSSTTLNQDIRANSKRMREAYANAQSSDAIISKELQDSAIVDSLRMLSQSKEELLRLFPKEEPNLLDFDESAGDVNSRTTAAFGPDAVKLETKLHEMADLIESRNVAFESIKKISQMDFMELVASSLGSSNEQLAAIQEQHLNACREGSAIITKGLQQQEQLLAEILQLNTSFLKSREMSPLAIKNNAVIQSIEQNVAKYFSLHSQISAGVTFYSNLQSKLTTLLQSSDDLAYTQQWQRSEFESSRTSVYQKTSQETSDHEYAMSLAAQLNAEPTPAPPTKPSVAGKPTAKDIVYGTPVSGPPSNATYQGTGGAVSSTTQAPVSNVTKPQPAVTLPSYYPPAPAAVPSQQPHQSQYHQQLQQAGVSISYGQTAALPMTQQPLLTQPQSPYAPGHQETPPPSSYAPPGAQYVQQQHQQQQQQPVHSLHNQYVQPPAPHASVPATYNNPYVPQPPPAASTAAGGYQYNSYGSLPAAPAQSQALPPQQFHQPPAGSQFQQPPAVQQHHYQPQAAPAPAPTGQYYSPQHPPAPQQQQQFYPPQQQPQQQQYYGQQQQYQHPPAPTGPNDYNRKISTLCEMGFSRDNAMNALNANNGDEEAALNSLLSGGANDAPATGPPVPTTTAAPSTTNTQAPATSNGGFFGKIWGK